MSWTWTWETAAGECGLRLRVYTVERWQGDIGGTSPYAAFNRYQDDIPEAVLQEVIAALQSDAFNEWRSTKEACVRTWVAAWSEVRGIEDNRVPRTRPIRSARDEWNRAKAGLKTRADTVTTRTEDGAVLHVSHWDPLRLITCDGRTTSGPGVTLAPSLALNRTFFVVDPKTDHLILLSSDGSPLPSTHELVDSHGFGVAVRVVDLHERDDGLWAQFYVAETDDHLPLAQLLGNEGLVKIDSKLRLILRGRLR